MWFWNAHKHFHAISMKTLTCIPRRLLYLRPYCINDSHDSAKKWGEPQYANEQRCHLSGPPGLSRGLTVENETSLENKEEESSLQCSLGIRYYSPTAYTLYQPSSCKTTQSVLLVGLQEEVVQTELRSYKKKCNTWPLIFLFIADIKAVFLLNNHHVRVCPYMSSNTLRAMSNTGFLFFCRIVWEKTLEGKN